MLQQLVDELRRKSPLTRSTVEMAALLSAAGAAWSPRPLVERAGGYTRTCACSDENFDVVLINWSAGAPSPIHDHGDQHCWLLVLSGHLLVDDYVRLDAGEVPGSARIRAQGQSLLESGGLDLRSGRFSLHRVAATPDAPAVTLHVYAAPIREYLVYDEVAGSCAVASGAYDDIV